MLTLSLVFHKPANIRHEQMFPLVWNIHGVCSFSLCLPGLADRERQAHFQVWPHCGVGDTPGVTHHSALSPHPQPSGKSHLERCVGGSLIICVVKFESIVSYLCVEAFWQRSSHIDSDTSHLGVASVSFVPVHYTFIHLVGDSLANY